jgi:2-polyprenyl-3-methyl-5-hydroxy-6-metoxy-1,4-benzoquinol methylase
MNKQSYDEDRRDIVAFSNDRVAARVNRSTATATTATSPVAQTFRDGTDHRAAADQARYLAAATAQETILAGKVARADLAAAVPGSRVLDVGCGIGDFCLLLAQRHPAVTVVGVDPNKGLLQDAARRADDAGLAIEFRDGDGAALPFDDDSFDVVTVERTLQHVADPTAVVREMARVTRPGGTVLLTEPDWGSLAIDAGDPALTELVVRQVVHSVRHPLVGRQLRRIALDAGLVDPVVTAEPHLTTDLAVARHLALLDEAVAALRADGEVDDAELDRWVADLERDAARDRFGGALTLFVARATVPAP